ncbi:hypothetical protein HY572_05680 [Candidatus Micrarchaeota archaeon]|nr:hypothetical protein [Candidatus Micrarchaeota archaeon]
MRDAFFLVLAAAAFAAGFFVHGFLSPVAVDSALVQPVFSPEASEPVLLGLIASARHSVNVQLYQFSYAPLLDALIDASNRGAMVRVVLDPQIESNLFTAEKLALSGVAVRWASRDFASTHAKFMVVDGVQVFVGSTNWSRHAMKLNREAAVLIQDSAVAQRFLDVFESDFAAGSDWKTS